MLQVNGGRGVGELWQKNGVEMELVVSALTTSLSHAFHAPGSCW